VPRRRWVRERRREDASGEAAVLHGCTAREEVDVIHEARMDDARANRRVKEKRDADAVDEIAGVAGGAPRMKK